MPPPEYGPRLRAALGPMTRPRPIDSSPRSSVWRADVGGVPAVVKQVVGGADAGARFEREVTALRLAARAGPPLVPAILGTDPGRRVIVLEYVDGGDPPADWVVHYATALARLHATTTADDDAALPRWSPPCAGDVAAFLRLAGELGVAATPAVRAELDGVLHRLGRAGHSLLHGDPCPGNDLYTAGGVRFVDLEQASLGDGLTELAYLRIGFPTCWCVTAPPASLLRRAEDAYRAAWRLATGAEPHGDLADACAGWLLRGDALVEKARRDGTDHLAAVTRTDWGWGTATARERLLHRVGVVRDVTAGRADLTALHDLLAALRARILDRWPAPVTAARDPPLTAGGPVAPAPARQRCSVPRSSAEEGDTASGRGAGGAEAGALRQGWCARPAIEDHEGSGVQPQAVEMAVQLGQAFGLRVAAAGVMHLQFDGLPLGRAFAIRSAEGPADDDVDAAASDAVLAVEMAAAVHDAVQETEEDQLAGGLVVGLPAGQYLTVQFPTLARRINLQ